MTSYPSDWTLVKNVGDGSTFDKAAYTAYETVKSERDALRETEVVYKRKVAELERDAEKLLKSYNDIYDESKMLRMKLERGPDATRTKNFKTEIKKLEDKVAAVKGENELLTDEVYRNQKQLRKDAEEKQRINDAFKMERGLHQDKITKLEKDNNDLENKVLALERKVEEYEARINTYENESEGLLNRYKSLKQENTKMESKFKRQIRRLDEEIKNTLEINKDMTKEIIQLKTKHAKLRADYNSLKLDEEAAQKQVNFLNKELEVFQTQSSVLKRNVKVTTQEYNTLKEDLRSTEDMLFDARNFGFDTLFEERQSVKRKERLQLKRLNELEDQIQELTHENNSLESEAKEHRKKMEAAIMEKEAALMKVNSLKRRIEVLENANLELDRKTKFTTTNNTGVTIRKDNMRIKEREYMLGKIQDLELQNRRLTRQVKVLEKDDDDFEENVTLLSFKTSKTRKSKIIRPSLSQFSGSINSSAMYKGVKTSKSLPEK